MCKELFKKFLLGSAILLISLSSFVNLMRERKYINRNIKELITDKLDNENIDKHKFWAKKILSGGYILFFRHAERDKWIDVTMYDALELELQDENSNSYRFAENEYFEKALCLNKRGKIQAKAMGEVIKYSKLPVNYIVSSPSCRARQTANLMFEGYDRLEKNLIYKGPFTNVGDRSLFLEKYFLNLPKSKDKNTIIVAHNSLIGVDLFKEEKKMLGEGGFFVLSRKNNKLVLEHEFHDFSSFSKQFFIRKHK